MADISASALKAGPAIAAVSMSAQIETTFAGKLAAYRKAQAAYKAVSVAAPSAQHLSIEEDHRALDLMRHPASSLAEIREKIIIAQDIYLFDTDNGEDVRDLILKDVLAIAESHHV